MANVGWKIERQNLKKMIAERDGRILVAIGVGSGAEARQLHHTIYELYDQKAVPDFIGGFITFVSGYLCAAAYGLPDMGYILRAEITKHTDIVEQATYLAVLWILAKRRSRLVSISILDTATSLPPLS